MVSYSCKTCLKFFYKKSNYKAHLARKNKCEPPLEIDGKNNLPQKSLFVSSDMKNDEDDMMNESSKKINLLEEQQTEDKKDALISELSKKIILLEEYKIKNNEKLLNKIIYLEEQNDKLRKKLYEKEKKTEVYDMDEKITLLEKVTNAKEELNNVKKDFVEEIKNNNCIKNEKKEKLLQKIENIFTKTKETKASKSKISPKFRMMVWEKYIGLDKGTAKCKCCEVEMISQFNFQCGHIISEANGGKIVLDNLMPICFSCNNSMGKKDLFVFKKELNNFIENKNLDK
jgi:hypothetical protein